MQEHIAAWIQHLSLPQTSLGGMSVCPFAKKAVYEIIETNDIVVPDREFEIIIFVLSADQTQVQLFDYCKLLNEQYVNYIFLPDPKDRQTLIGDVQTNNGRYNLILCQPRDKLLSARKVLSKTNYYQYWSPEYLKEITGHDFY